MSARNRRVRVPALGASLALTLLAGALHPAAATAADPWDPFGEGLQNTNADLGYPAFVNSELAIPDTTAVYSPGESYLASVFEADQSAGAGTAPGKDFWIDRMLARDGVQPDEAGGLNYSNDTAQNIDYDNNVVLFSRGRALYMEESTASLGFAGDVAYIESLGNKAAYTLTAKVGESNVTLTEDTAKRHNTPSYWHGEFSGGGLLVKQTKWITNGNVTAEWLQISTTDGTSKDVVLTAASSFAATASGDELRGSITTPNNVTKVSTRLSGDGFSASGQSLTRTVSVGSAAVDVKLQMGFTTPEISESTTEFDALVAETPAQAFQKQTTAYNQWWVDNIAYVQTPSPEIDKTVFYRWWLLRTNFLDANVPGNDYQFPTSIEGVYGSAYNNAIVLTAGMFIEDMKYFRDPSSAYGTWLSAGEVARSGRYIDNPGNPNNWNSSYANYISEAAWGSYAVHGGDAPVAGRLAQYAEDDVTGNLAAFDKNGNNLVEYSNPAMTGNDVDAVSFSWRNTAAWSSYPMDRPETAYLYSGAEAAAEAYSIAGDSAGAQRMNDKAAAIKQSVLDVLWEDKRTTADESGFYGNMIKAAYSDGSSGLPAGSKIPWKEVNMYYPYTVGLMPKPGDADFDEKYLDAFRLFVDSAQYSPFPFYTANQADAKARAARDAGSGKHYSNNFSTINSTVIFRMLSSALRDYPNEYLTSDYFKKLLYWNAWAVYEKGDVTRQNENEFWAHGSAADGGSIKYRSWIHQTQLGTTNFAVVEDVAGLQPRADDKIELSPIDIGWDHFTVNNLRYHDKDLTIVWDEPGGTDHYADAPDGYSLYLDGERVLTIDELAPVTFDSSSGSVDSDAQVLFNAAQSIQAASDVRFETGDRVVDLLLKAGIDVDPASSAAVNQASGKTATASFSAAGSTGAGNQYAPAGAVDGSTVNEPFWGTAGSPNPSDWLEVDLGGTQKVDEARIHFYRSSSSTTIQGYSAPASYVVQYLTPTGWSSVSQQARTPMTPTGNLNTVRFAEVETTKLRLLVTHQSGFKTGVKELILRDSPIAYTPSVNGAPPVQLDRIPLADPSRASFVGSVSDDGLPSGILTQTWTVVEKPSATAVVSFTDPASPTTKATFSEVGSYLLRFSASDGDQTTAIDQGVEVSGTTPLGPDVSATATPTASYTASWNRIAAVNDATTDAGADQTKLWGTWSETRPAAQTLTYTWPEATRLTAASVYFWRDAAQGTGTGVAVPQSWKLEYRDGSDWKPVQLRTGTGYPTNDMGLSSEVAFAPVSTTALRATFSASSNADGSLHSAVGVSEFDVFADFPASFEELAKRTAVNQPTTLPSKAWVVFPDNSRGQLPVTWEKIPTASFSVPGTITVHGVFTASELPVTGTISVGDSGDEITAIEPQELSTLVGTAPDLPRTSVVTFSGGTGARETRAVTWDAVAPESYASAGQFVVHGAVEGTDIEATAVVNVERPSGSPSDLSIEITPSTRCVAGKAVLIVTVSNTEESPVAAEITTSFGTKTIETLQAGASVSSSFNSRKASIDSGEIGVTVSGSVDGVEVTSTHAEVYQAKSCG
ncbi:Ig-like domain-containing protein [Microbacterium sp. GXF0217]